MKTTLEAVGKFCKKTGFRFVGIYPNTDPGSYDILRAINKITNNNDSIKFYKTLPRGIFVNIMRNAKVLVGNSSMGILEAPFYKLPVVNVGNRQKGRLNAGNVVFVGYNIDEIFKEIKKAVFDKDYREFVANLKNPYGDSKSAYRVVDILANLDLGDRRWYVKKKLC